MPVRVLIQPPLCNGSNVGIWTCSNEPPNDRPPLRIKFGIVFPQPNINATLSRASTYSATNKLHFVHVFWRVDKLVAVVIPLVFFMELVKLILSVLTPYNSRSSGMFKGMVTPRTCTHPSALVTLCNFSTDLIRCYTLLPPKAWPETQNLCCLWCTRYLENFQGTSAPPTSWQTWCDLPWIIMTLVIIEIQGQLQESEQLLLWQFIWDYQRLKSV